MSIVANAKTNHNELVAFAPRQTPHYATVKRFSSKLKNGHQSLENKQRSGRPITAVIPDNINKVLSAIEENPYVTYAELVAETSLSIGNISTIIYEHLELRKTSHTFTPQNMAFRVRLCKENLAKFKNCNWRSGDVITGDESWFYL